MAQARFTGIGLHADDYRQMGGDDAAPSGHTSTGTVCALSEIEFLAGWATATDDTAAVDIAATVHQLAATFSPHHLTAGEFSGDRLDIGTAAARLRAVCDLLASIGVRVAVEAFPWSGLRDIATARAIVEASKATNAGLMIDVWHFYNTRSTLADLDGLPPEQIVAVQLNDGRLVDTHHLVEARRGRLLPGDGELDVARMLHGLHARGFRGPYCVEVKLSGLPEPPGRRDGAIRVR